MQGGEFYEGESRVWGRSKKRVLGLEGAVLSCYCILLGLIIMPLLILLSRQAARGGLERGELINIEIASSIIPTYLQRP